MSIVTLVVVLVVIGVILWFVNVYIPMDVRIKKILNIVVVAVVILWLLYAFGILPNLHEARVPQLG